MWWRIVLRGFEMTTRVKVTTAIIALLGLFALGAQLPITIAAVAENGGSTLFGVGRFLGYFTITTNIVCMIVMGMAALGKLKNPNWLSAITAYMVILCLVYWLLLSKNNHQTGWRFFIDSLLHYVLPLATLTAWITVFPKQGLTWADPFKWLVYPISYSVYAMVRGAIGGWYPYFFLNVTDLGYAKVALNTFGLALLFLIAGLILVAGARGKT
jgi:hypothetical protein